MKPVIFSDKAIRELGNMTDNERKRIHELIKKLSSV